jgi:hypothetical protein
MDAASFSPYRSETSYAPLFVQNGKTRAQVPGIIKKTKKRVALASILPSIRPEGVPDFFLTSTRQEVRILLSWNT